MINWKAKGVVSRQNVYSFNVLVFMNTLLFPTGDAMGYSTNMQFSTKDADDGKNCASRYKGAWWFNECYFVSKRLILNILFLIKCSD